MNQSPSQTIETLGEFLAHALELEHESAERYRELADSMEVHHNPETAELLRKLAEVSEDRAAEVGQRAEGVQMPEIPPWDFKWNCPGSPESACMEGDISYLMNTRQTLELALHNETRGRDFYAQVAASSPNQDVRRLAADMAEEETEHMDLLRRWAEHTSHQNSTPQEDLDPPNMPE